MSEGEQADNSQKTEDPTPKKLQEARKKGQVALSREVNNWVILLAATLLIGTFSVKFFQNISKILTSYFSHLHDFPSVPGSLNIVLGDAFHEVMVVMALPMLVLMLAAFLAPFAQIGPLYSAEAIKPDIGKISPIKGFGRLFSKRSLVEFAKGLIKITVIGIVGFVILYPYFGQSDHMVGLPVPLLMLEIRMIVIKMMIGILVALMVIAAIDLVYQRYEHAQKMRMTKQEVKDEYKQTEGDPHVKAKLRQLRSERARRRMMQAVPRADVVITNPTHFAVALEYKPEVMEAPVCIAKGADLVAFRIREIAKENNIIIHENPPLARTLYDTVDIDEMIPAEQYKAVAEVISYVFKTRKTKPLI